MRPRLPALIACAAALLATVGGPHAAPSLDDFTRAQPGCGEAPTCYPIALHIATTPEGPVRPPTWVAEQLTVANTHFAPSGIAFELAATTALPATAATVTTRQDRDRLAEHAHHPNAINVYIVATLMDVDRPGEQIRGVHWRERPDRARRWIVLSSIAPPLVLAHELGHYFGLPHSTDPSSIMNKTPRTTPPFETWTFPPKERARLEQTARRIERSREVQVRRPTRR
jgi:hypothetical protein